MSYNGSSIIAQGGWSYAKQPMSADEYQKGALRTKSDKFYIDEINVDLLHAAMGLETEVGEFTDPLKKKLFYNKPLDLVNLREEIGDMLWYIAIACEALGTTIATEMRRNNSKLRERFPQKFTEEEANVRDLDAERKILEG